MIFHGKEVEIILIGDAKKYFEALQTKVAKEISKGITSSPAQTLFNNIKAKIDLLKTNPSYGIQIPKDRIPKSYVKEYDANNLWKVNLSGHWRMIYTIQGKEVKIIALVLDIFDHKRYDDKFGY